MLEPENRHLMTDALRPPDGHAVELAVATTYTLDLTSVLLAPLAMAAYDQSHADLDGGATPLALLESVRRHAEHTTVLCQAAGIHVPADYPKLAAFAEGCVAEVLPPAGRTFHPKIWLLRFTDGAGGRRHRFACLSRNLTSERSWDTLLVLDEDPEATRWLDPAPIGTFVRELLDSTVRPLAPARREQVLDMCSTLSATRLALPEPFTVGRVVALGTPSGDEWPLPARASALAVVSPFLDVQNVRRLPVCSTPPVLLSRPDTFERLGSNALAGLNLRVLQAVADAASSVDEGTEPTSVNRTSTTDVTRGLHAKVFAWEADGQAHMLTGSANCTTAAFDGNVELSVLLSGPPASCGPKALLGDDSTGFLRLTQPYVPARPEPTPDPVYDAERLIEAWHADLASARPRLLVSDEDGSYDVLLDVNLTDDPDGLAARTDVHPVGGRSTPWRPLASGARWRGVGLAGLTPYLAVRTKVEVGDQTVVRDCVLVCEVVGAPDDRLQLLLRGLLARQEDVLRYLALLLGDPSVDDLVGRLLSDAAEDDDEDGSGSSAQSGPSFDDLVLVEPLVRAAARRDDSLRRAHRLLQDLRDADGQLPQLDDEFLSLWEVVWEGSQS